MRVLVIGGTGYVGHRILEQLLQRGADVAVVSRGNLAPAVMSQVQHFTVDRKDRAGFESMFQSERFDAVIDNIAYDRADIESAARAFGGRVRQYLFTSSMAIYHDASALDPLQETDAELTFLPGPNDTMVASFHPTQGAAYGNGKRQAELALTELDDSVFSFTVLRAPIVVGPDDRTRRIWWFVQRLRDGGPLVIPDWGPGRLFQVVDADDLARAFAEAVGNPPAYRKAYNVAQPEIFTAETWIDSFATALGVSGRYARVPEPMLQEVGLGDYIMPIAGRPFGQFMMDTHAIRTDLGFTFTEGREWIRRAAVGCASAPPTRDSDGYGLRAEEVSVAEAVLREQAEVWNRVRQALPTG